MKLYIKFFKEYNWKLYKPNTIYENKDFIYLINKKGKVYKSFKRIDIYHIDIKQ